MNAEKKDTKQIREELLKKYTDARELHRKFNDVLNEMRELIKEL